MNVLPWLLDWPPSRGTVVVFVVLTAFSLGTLALFAGVIDDIETENATVESADLSVSLNDEASLPDDANGSVQTCLASGTPPDSIAVLGDVTVTIPDDLDGARGDGDPPSVVVSLAHTQETTSEPVDRTGRVTRDVFWVLDDDERLSVGETTSVQVRVRAGNETVAETTRETTVENGSRTYRC